MPLLMKIFHAFYFVLVHCLFCLANSCVCIVYVHVWHFNIWCVHKISLMFRITQTHIHSGNCYDTKACWCWFSVLSATRFISFLMILCFVTSNMRFNLLFFSIFRFFFVLWLYYKSNQQPLAPFESDVNEKLIEMYHEIAENNNPIAKWTTSN